MNRSRSRSRRSSGSERLQPEEEHREKAMCFCDALTLNGFRAARLLMHLEFLLHQILIFTGGFQGRLSSADNTLAMTETKNYHFNMSIPTFRVALQILPLILSRTGGVV